MYYLKIDCRERDLIELVKANMSALSKDASNFEICYESLDVGDIIIADDDVPILIIERKKVADLASSIKDGRYKEQAFRLNAHPLHNHNIMYLVEGAMRDRRMDRNTLFSSVFSLNHVQGFSVWRTANLEETHGFIMNTIKYMSRGNRVSFYKPIPADSADATEGEGPTTQDYASVIKMSKKDNITPRNISEIMLCQVPGISIATSKAVLRKFGCMVDLIADLQEHGKTCLEDVCIEMDSGKKRKIGKPAITNLMKFLIEDDASNDEV